MLLRAQSRYGSESGKVSDISLKHGHIALFTGLLLRASSEPR